MMHLAILFPAFSAGDWNLQMAREFKAITLKSTAIQLSRVYTS